MFPDLTIPRCRHEPMGTAWGKHSVYSPRGAHWFVAASVFFSVKSGSALNYYDNGIQVGSSTAGGDIEANPFYWGGDPGASSEFADGLIDDVSLWNAALTPDQIRSLAAGSPRFRCLGLPVKLQLTSKRTCSE